MFHQFVKRRGLQTASSLAYTTLLSLVPLIAVMFSFFGNLPVFKDINEIIQEFVFNNLVPAFGQTVKDYLIDFSIKASKLTTTGIIILVIIALMLMATIDTALNNIWNITSRRKPLARFLIYWSILTLGPILLGIGLYSTSYLLSLPVIDSVDTSLRLKTRVLIFIPFFTTTIAFSLLYILVPNCYVSRRNALIGGITAALLFEIAKYMFGIFVKAVPTYEMIYGALAVMPMFLIWIYLSWVIVLLGAQVAYSLSVFRLETGEKYNAKTNWDFFDIYTVIAELWLAQKKGQYLSAIQISQSGIKMPYLSINEILEILKRDNWVYRNTSGQWILTRDLNELSLYDLYKLFTCKFPVEVSDSLDKWQLTLEDIVNKQKNDLGESLQITIGEVLRRAEK
jgi:membrane protein